MFRRCRLNNQSIFLLSAVHAPSSATHICFTHSLTGGSAHSSDLSTTTRVHATALKRGYTDQSVNMHLVLTYFQSSLKDHAQMLLDEVLLCGVELVIGNLMIAKLMRIGQYEGAMKVFDEMCQRDVVTWNSVISGCVKNLKIKEVFVVFKEMMRLNVEPDEFTFASMMAGCAKLGAVSHAEWIHGLMIDKGIKMNSILASALIDMYSKCGMIDTAKGIFKSVQRDNVCVYNTMINGLAVHGLAMEAIQLLSQMEFDNVLPDAITFVGLLKACGHDGLIDEGRNIFALMSQKHSIQPQLEHYGAVVDLLCRAGLLEEAYRLITTMSIEPDVVIWRSVLSSCKTYKKPGLGELAASKISQLQSGDYVLLSNTYCSIEKWESAATLRKSMQMKKVQKNQGKSWIEIAGSIHVFKAGDQTHPESKLIYKILDSLVQRVKLEGFVFSRELVMMDVSSEEKERNLRFHSEKLAVAFGILQTGPGAEISIFKNLRTCYDCHSWIKLVSKVLNRVIMVRDRIRFHRFEGGLCSCRDYW